MRYTVVIDDDDRADAPDCPWTATVNDPEVIASGIGQTPVDALHDLAVAWRTELLDIGGN